MILKDVYVYPELFGDLFVHHYKRSILKIVYNIVGGFDLVGAPVTLFKGFSNGFYSFFVEPAKGIVQSPQAFGKGLKKGTMDLISGSITGVFGAASKVFGSIGSGVSVLTMDNQYQNSRKQSKLRHKPKNIGDGIYQGGMALGKGIWSGVSGIVAQPIKGFKEDGATGVLKGVGKGIVGVVTKPVVGATDLATNLTDGMKNTANFKIDTLQQRIRVPRWFDVRKLVVYDFENSIANYIINIKAKYNKETKILCKICNFETNTAILITDNYAFCLQDTLIVWSLPISAILNVILLEEQLKLGFTIKDDDVTLFNNVTGYTIDVDHLENSQQIYNHFHKNEKKDLQSVTSRNLGMGVIEGLISEGSLFGDSLKKMIKRNQRKMDPF